MSKKFLNTASLIVAVFSASLAGAAPITTDSDPALTGAAIEDFSSAVGVNGVTSQIFADVILTGSSSFNFYNGSDGQYAAPNPSGDTYLASDAGSLTFTFDSLMSAFAIQIGNVNALKSLTAYDASNNVIESISIPLQEFGYFYGIASATANIAKFDIVGGAGDTVIYDDLHYTASVPAPSMLLLFGLGLLGVRLIRQN